MDTKITCEILEIQKDRIKFALNNCDAALANTLRRIIISEGYLQLLVPTMAIHMVNVFENTSVLNDQFISHRLGLIPFVSDGVDKYQYTWKCDCKQAQCHTCKVYFQLYIKNKQETTKEITSNDIIATYQIMSDDCVKPVKYFSDIHPQKQVGIPILKLTQNQTINIKMIAEKGTGKMHAKWSPVAIATFHPEAEIKIDQVFLVNQQKIHNISFKDKQKIAKSCPRNVFTVNPKSDLIGVSSQKCIYCDQCKKACDQLQMPNLIKIIPKKNKFIFTVQGTGAMKPSLIIKKAFLILRQKLQNVKKQIIV